MNRGPTIAVVVAGMAIGVALGFVAGQGRDDIGWASLAGFVGVEQDPMAAAVAVAAPESPDAGGASEGRVLYYRNPMGLPDVSPVPKKDSMGMDYIPVYESDAAVGDNVVSVSLAKVQKLGVVTEPATLRALARAVNAVGTVAIDERGVTVVTTRFEGWIERLYANTTGAVVGRGETLMEVYSPAVLQAEEEYLVALSARGEMSGAEEAARATIERLVEATTRRLANLGVDEAEIGRLALEKTARRLFAVPSPAAGQIIAKMVVEGARVMPGEPLFTIADLATVWVLADVFEQDLAMVRQGQIARVKVTAYPAAVFEGRVDFIYPTISPATRTAKVRIELANPDRLLKADMYANVVIESPVADAPVLTVPESAVLDNGVRRVVLVERGAGLFEPRVVTLGQRGAGLVEITGGLAADERVVVSANFLIDAESNLQTALRAFASGETAASATTTPEQAPTNAP